MKTNDDGELVDVTSSTDYDGPEYETVLTVEEVIPGAKAKDMGTMGYVKEIERLDREIAMLEVEILLLKHRPNYAGLQLALLALALAIVALAIVLL